MRCVSGKVDRMLERLLLPPSLDNKPVLQRFCYYGLRTVLVLYLRSSFKYDENTSTAIIHGFIMMCYFFPLLGAVVADSYWGRVWSIESVWAGH
jgi:ABC-type transport system involved in cytochrome c biogenesis permease subunit